MAFFGGPHSTIFTDITLSMFLQLCPLESEWPLPHPCSRTGCRRVPGLHRELGFGFSRTLNLLQFLISGIPFYSNR